MAKDNSVDLSLDLTLSLPQQDVTKPQRSWVGVGRDAVEALGRLPWVVHRERWTSSSPPQRQTIDRGTSPRLTPDAGQRFSRGRSAWPDVFRALARQGEHPAKEFTVASTRVTAPRPRRPLADPSFRILHPPRAMQPATVCCSQLRLSQSTHTPDLQRMAPQFEVLVADFSPTHRPLFQRMFMTRFELAFPRKGRRLNRVRLARTPFRGADLQRTYIYVSSHSSAAFLACQSQPASLPSPHL